MTPYYQDSHVVIHHGDCLDVMRTLPDASVDAVVTDPPYGLEFMGKDWDGSDGFRRSLNPTDVAPEYRTSGAGQKSAPGIGDRTTEWVSNQGWNAYRCSNCGHLPHGGSPCSCEAPNMVRSDNRWQVFQQWCEAWATEALRVLKPGGYMLAFGGSRTWHRLASAVEDAGFEIRDSIAWLYGSGFPKSLDVSKAIDKAAGEWRGRASGIESANGSMSGANYGRTDKGDPVTPAAAAAGWGTALKPAFEPIVVGRKPLIGTVAANWLEHGTGAINIDGCRVESDRAPQVYTVNRLKPGATLAREGGTWRNDAEDAPTFTGATPSGRWPTNVVLDGSQADALDAQTGVLTSGRFESHHADNGKTKDIYGAFSGNRGEIQTYGDSAGASKFFPTFRYEAKAGSAERPRDGDTAHPTVKPLDLMRWLVRLVTPPGGTVLEPFLGSGTTAEACVIEGFRCIGIERDATYLPLAVNRLSKPIQPDLFGSAS